MKQKSACYLLPMHPVFNPEKVRIFENFDPEHSSLLWKSLYHNAFEVLSQNPVPTIFFLDESDREYLPDYLKTSSENIFFIELSDTTELFSNLNEKYFTEAENNILFMFNSIGYTSQDIQKTKNLLSINDDALILARSTGNKLCFTGFNKYNNFLNANPFDYAEVLAHSCRADNYIFTLDNYLLINEISDFKKLYLELSKKESIAYCSHELHEQFTHLFIEYKDLLK